LDHKAAYVAIWWCVVDATLIKIIFLHVDNIRTVELLEDSYESPSIPVVSNSTAIVALTRQICHSIVLDILNQPYLSLLIIIIIIIITIIISTSWPKNNNNDIGIKFKQTKSCDSSITTTTDISVG